MTGSVRRVVTGTAPDGRAFVAADEQVDALTVAAMPGAEFVRLWGADGPPVLPDPGDPRPTPEYFPPPGGYRCYFVTLPPVSTTPPEDPGPGPGAGARAAAAAELATKLPGLAELMDPDHPGMHASATVDWNIVLDGEVWLELAGGDAVLLRAGDSAIVHGGSHAWRNALARPCRLATVSLGCASDPE